MSVLRDVLILADTVGSMTEIWNKRTRPRNMSFSILFPLHALFSSPSLWAIHLLCVFSNSSLESRLLPWQHRYAEDFTEGHRTREGWKKTQRLLPSRPFSFISLSFFSDLLPIFRLLRLADQMFEKINKTLPADSFYRLLFLRHGPLCFSLLLSLSAPTRHFASHVERRIATMREKWRAGIKGVRWLRRVECTRGALRWGHRVSGTADRMSMYSCLDLLLRDPTSRKHRSFSRNLPTRMYVAMSCPENITDRLFWRLGYWIGKWYRYSISNRIREVGSYFDLTLNISSGFFNS